MPANGGKVIAARKYHLQVDEISGKKILSQKLDNTMTDIKPTLDNLFSDNGAFDESEVVTAIQPHVTIQRSTNAIFLKDSTLSVEKRILVYGLAKKLLKLKDLVEDEKITPLEIHQKTGIKKGSIDPSIKRLKDGGLLVGKGSSEIPNFKIAEIITLLKAK